MIAREGSAPTRDQAGRGEQLWAWWVLASAAGGALLGAAFGLPGPSVLLAVALYGAIFALPQSLVLRRYIDDAGWWIGLTTVGAIGAWIAGILALLLAAGALGAVVSLLGAYRLAAVLAPLLVLLPGACGGLMVGARQHWMLEERGVSRRWWLLASTAGGILLGEANALWLGQLFSGPDAGLYRLAFFVAAGAVVGAAYGVLTGPLLAPLVGGALSGVVGPRPEPWVMLWALLSVGALSIALPVATNTYERGASRRLAEDAAASLRIGMPLDEARRALERATGGVLRFECPAPGREGPSRMVFSFGRRDPTEAPVVVAELGGPPRQRSVAEVWVFSSEAELPAEALAGCRRFVPFWD